MYIIYKGLNLNSNRKKISSMFFMGESIYDSIFNKIRLHIFNALHINWMYSNKLEIIFNSCQF